MLVSTKLFANSRFSNFPVGPFGNLGDKVDRFWAFVIGEALPAAADEIFFSSKEHHATVRALAFPLDRCRRSQFVSRINNT